MLSRSQSRIFYDRLGARQDLQAYYEDPATEDLIRHADFESAYAVVELGPGTGRFALKILEDFLPENATYKGYDISATMVGLSNKKLGSFNGRAQVKQTEGLMDIPGPDETYDTFVANYVLDLFSETDIKRVMAESYRVLKPHGKLCLVSLTFGQSLVSRSISIIWKYIHQIRASWVGGCRPIRLLHYISEEKWKIHYHKVVVSYGIASDVLVAIKK